MISYFGRYPGSLQIVSEWAQLITYIQYEFIGLTMTNHMFMNKWMDLNPGENART